MWLKAAVNEVFGYGSLPVSFVHANRDDISALVNENGWNERPGLTVYSYHRTKSAAINWNQVNSQKAAREAHKSIKKKKQ